MASRRRWRALVGGIGHVFAWRSPRVTLSRPTASDALAIAAETTAYVWIPDVIECLAGLAKDLDNLREAARLFGVAEAIRKHTGPARVFADVVHHRGGVDEAGPNGQGRHRFPRP